MRRDNRLNLVLATALLFCAASLVYGREGFCSHCGCNRACEKICRLVCEDKKVEVICWGYQCEDFCVPGPSCRGCKHCEMVCEECSPNADGVHSKPKPFVWFDWIPKRGPTIYTRTKLMKKITSKKVPSYKWVVEDLCENCEANAPCASVTPDVELPPVPVADARLKYEITPEEPVTK